MNNDKEERILTQTIIRLVESKKPQNVRQLIELVKKNASIPEAKIIERVIQLQNQGKITLEIPPKPIPKKLRTYLKTKEASWYWTTLSLAVMTAIAVFIIPENAYPLVYARYFLGLAFVLWLPGYTLNKTLFPREALLKASSKSLDSIERVALSVGFSIATVPIIGLLLYFSPFGMGLTPTVLGVLTFTLVFATAGVVREHSSQVNRAIKRNTTS